MLFCIELWWGIVIAIATNTLFSNEMTLINPIWF